MHSKAMASICQRWFARDYLILALCLCLALPLATQAQVTDQDRQFWSFRPLARSSIPKVKHTARVRTPIDAFLLQKLEAKGLTFSPDADRRTLARRVYLDLLGLPPSPAESDAFVNDDRPDAYERLFDRLLASPHFGERWGRHWLDNVGYSDVTGTDNDAGIIRLSEGKWRYRDYVIRSFNEDKPFARFLTEQLAGDELVDWRAAKSFTPDVKELLIATGFLRQAADDTDESELNTPDIRHGVWQRTAETVASNLLGLTLNCAKCHDHKFEPISQRDYYGFLALLAPVFNVESWRPPKDRALPEIAPAQKAEIDRHNEALEKEVAELKKLLAAKKDATKKEQEAVEQKIAAVKARRKSWKVIQAAYDVGPPAPTRLLRRGNHLAPRQEVSAGFIGVLCASDAAGVATVPKPVDESSGRRLALARWLTDFNSPAGALVLRVRVNRIWQQLFGRGIVASADNLGLTGARPSHPELLEWLAAEFRQSDGRLKPFLKQLMMSTAYRQTSTVGSDRIHAVPAGIDRINAVTTNARPQAVDPDNQLLWRMRLRRLESETIRDSLLAVSGRLNLTPGGPAVPVEGRPDGTFVVKGASTDTSRRSVYLLARRNYHPTILSVFDQPAMTTNCTGRPASAVVLQSLTMLNDAFVLEQAQGLAERVAREVGADAPEKQIDRAFRLVFSRPPSTKELELARELLERQSAHYRRQNLSADEASRQALGHLCHMLVNANEFLYVP
jgi:hypothetical protein